MLESFKRLFAKPGNDRDYTPISEWAQRRGYGFKRVRDEDGFVIDGAFDNRPWRIEWGPPQREYIEGHELRLRMELDLPSDMQMLLLSRPLMDALERATFEEFTDDVQTQIGTKTPEEMRWLVMFPKVNLSTLKSLLRDEPPFVLMTLRGRTYLRMQLESPQPQALAAALALFETAVAQALRAASGATDSGVDWPATGATTAWQSYEPDPPAVPPKRR
jgi:hypothetical protein